MDRPTARTWGAKSWFSHVPGAAGRGAVRPGAIFTICELHPWDPGRVPRRCVPRSGYVDATWGAALSREETTRFLGLDLEEKGVQPVWRSRRAEASRASSTRTPGRERPSSASRSSTGTSSGNSASSPATPGGRGTSSGSTSTPSTRRPPCAISTCRASWPSSTRSLAARPTQGGGQKRTRSTSSADASRRLPRRRPLR